jgi:hypothetical protein
LQNQSSRGQSPRGALGLPPPQPQGSFAFWRLTVGSLPAAKDAPDRQLQTPCELQNTPSASQPLVADARLAKQH